MPVYGLEGADIDDLAATLSEVLEMRLYQQHSPMIGPWYTNLDLQAVASVGDVLDMIEIARSVSVSAPVKTYILDLVEATRTHPSLVLGASPRSALFLQRLARARAASLGRDYVLPDDIKALAHPVLEHRMAMRPEAHMRGESTADAVGEILGRLSVPGTTTRIAT